MKNKPKFTASTTTFERNYSEYVNRLEKLEHMLRDIEPVFSFKPRINTKSKQKVPQQWDWQSFLDRNKKYTDEDEVDLKQSNSDEDLHHNHKVNRDDDDMEFYPRLNNETVRIILEKHINGQMIDLNLHLKKNRINFYMKDVKNGVTKRMFPDKIKLAEKKLERENDIGK